MTGFILKLICSMFVFASVVMFSVAAYGQSNQQLAAERFEEPRAFGTGPMNFGLLVGGTLANPKYTVDGGQRDTNPEPGWQAGIQTDLALSGPFYLTPGFDYSERRFSSTAEASGSAANIKMTFRYLELPMLVRFKPQINRIKPFIGGGAYVGYLWGVKASASDAAGNQKAYDLGKSNFREVDLGFIGNAGAEIAVSPVTSIVFDLRYQQGLMNSVASRVDKKFDDITHRSMTLQTGMAFAM